MKIIKKLIVNTITTVICFTGLHYALVVMSESLYPLVNNFKLLHHIYAGILSGEFALLAVVVLLGIGALFTLVQLFIGE